MCDARATAPPFANGHFFVYESAARPWACGRQQPGPLMLTSPFHAAAAAGGERRAAGSCAPWASRSDALQAALVPSPAGLRRGRPVPRLPAVQTPGRRRARGGVEGSPVTGCFHSGFQPWGGPRAPYVLFLGHARRRARPLPCLPTLPAGRRCSG